MHRKSNSLDLQRTRKLEIYWIRTYFCSTVNILDVEDAAQAVQEYFGQCGYELRGRDEDVDARGSGNKEM